MVVSHHHTDHYRGLKEIILYGYDVSKAIYDNGSEYTNDPWEEFVAAAQTTTAGGLTTIQLGDVIDLGGGATATCVAVNGNVIGVGPIDGALDNESDRSIGLLVEYGDFDYIILGDNGGGEDDNACTGRSTQQVNIETPLVYSIMPGGANPLLNSFGVEVANVSHHGSESSTNSDYMNLLTPSVACINVGDGQGANWNHPRKDVVENVLLAQASCITAPPALVLQTEEGNPTGRKTSFAGYCVGDIIITTDGTTSFTVDGTGAVSQGPDERADAGLPKTFPLDEVEDTSAPVISNVRAENVTGTSAEIAWDTDEPATSVVKYGTTSGSYTDTVSDGNLVTAHRVGLSGLSTSTTYYYVVESADASGNTATSDEYTFTTDSASTSIVNYAPASTTILQGSLASGSFSDLGADDGTYFVVNSARSGRSSITDWYGETTISESPGSVTKLTVTYDGKYSEADRSQTLYLYDFTNSSWTQIDSRTVGTSDLTITYTPTSPTDFISSAGVIRLRVSGTGPRNPSFSCSGDFMQFTVESGGAKPLVTNRATGVVPYEVTLFQNSPNPFNPQTTIAYRLNKPGRVLLQIFDMQGRLVRTLVDETQEANHYSISWDGINDAGVKVSSGIYVYRLQTRATTQTRRMILLK